MKLWKKIVICALAFNAFLWIAGGLWYASMSKEDRQAFRDKVEESRKEERKKHFWQTLRVAHEEAQRRRERERRMGMRP